PPLFSLPVSLASHCITARTPRPTLFPYPTPFRSRAVAARSSGRERAEPIPFLDAAVDGPRHRGPRGQAPCQATASRCGADAVRRDRKSTRLNSSHVKSSYAVFCLKKKKGHVVRTV